MQDGLGFERLKAAFAEQALFEDKTWRISPEAWPLTAKQIREVEQIGQACLEFYRASELLYMRSCEGKNILRNAKLVVPWVADYLDRGKPAYLVEHARSSAVRRSHPMVIRPDLLMTDEGFALTEIDSVPGGIGLTAFLNELYAHGKGIVGADDCMITAFYEAMASLRPDKELPLIGAGQAAGTGQAGLLPASGRSVPGRRHAVRRYRRRSGGAGCPVPFLGVVRSG